MKRQGWKSLALWLEPHSRPHLSVAWLTWTRWRHCWIPRCIPQMGREDPILCEAREPRREFAGKHYMSQAEGGCTSCAWVTVRSSVEIGETSDTKRPTLGPWVCSAGLWKGWTLCIETWPKRNTISAGKESWPRVFKIRMRLEIRAMISGEGLRRRTLVKIWLQIEIWNWTKIYSWKTWTRTNTERLTFRPWCLLIKNRRLDCICIWSRPFFELFWTQSYLGLESSFDEILALAKPEGF
jgi:hypothetical protein